MVNMKFELEYLFPEHCGMIGCFLYTLLRVRINVVSRDIIPYRYQ